jgi:hypothetical protein
MDKPNPNTSEGLRLDANLHELTPEVREDHAAFRGGPAPFGRKTWPLVNRLLGSYDQSAFGMDWSARWLLFIRRDYVNNLNI